MQTESMGLAARKLRTPAAAMMLLIPLACDADPATGSVGQELRDLEGDQEAEFFEEGEWIWMDLPHQSAVGVGFSWYPHTDVALDSIVGFSHFLFREDVVEDAGIDWTNLHVYSWFFEPAKISLTEGFWGSNFIDLNEDSAQPDLAWVAASATCGELPQVDVLLYARGGEAPPVEPSDFFSSWTFRDLSECRIDGFVGEVERDGDRRPFSYRFHRHDHWNHLYAKTRMIRSSPDPGHPFLVRAFADTPVPPDHAYLRHRGGCNVSYDEVCAPGGPRGWLYGGGAATPNAQKFKAQADCGSGYVDLFDLDGGGVWDSGPPDPENWSDHDLFFDVFKTCDVRVGVWKDTSEVGVEPPTP